MDNTYAYYAASVSQFLRDAESGECLASLINIIPNAEREERKSEIESWRHNIIEMAALLDSLELAGAFIAFELFAPLSEKRIDCALFGKDDSGRKRITIIELKQWSNAKIHWAQDGCNYELDESFATRLTTVIAGNKETLIHPCEQCKSYLDRFNTSLKAIIDGSLEADALAYCYNYNNTDRNILADSRYNSVISEVPLYYRDDFEKLRHLLSIRFCKGDGLDCFEMLKKGFAEPFRFMDKARNLINGDGFLKEFAHNTDQAKAERGIISSVRKILGQNRKKQVFIVNGGPGTGKTIVGMRLLCLFLQMNRLESCQRNGYSFHPLYMIRSAAVRGFLKGLLTDDFYKRYITSGPFSNNYARGDDSAYRIVLYDECHRLGEESNPISTVNSLLDNFEIIVFLMDENQCVAGNYQSPKELIRRAMNGRQDVDPLNLEYTLETQMRCDSSDDYIKWVESIIYGEQIFAKKSIDYDFRICTSAVEMKTLLEAKREKASSVRICAGYCWPWHSTLKDVENGIFHDDIVIGAFRMPWNTYKFGKKQINPPKGYVSKDEWAFREEGIKQVGCIYTAQGLEFQYVGVIVGPDLFVENGVLKTAPAAHNGGSRIDKEGNPVDWDSLFNQSADGLKDTFIRNIYRVLLTRGMKGCYVYFCDEEVRKYVEARMPQFQKAD